MKKLLAIILSVFMALTVAPMAFATGETIDEALNADGGTLSFTTTDWEVAEVDTRVCAVSTNHGGNSKSEIKAIVTVEAGDIVTYDVKCSSEEGYDGLVFSVDGTPVNGFTGEIDWTMDYYVFAEAGTYLLAWQYIKDVSDDAGDDCAWVDNIYVGANDFELEGIYVTPSLTMGVDTEAQIEVVAIPTFVELGEVTFESADETVATVDENGVVTANKVGETTIAVKCESFTETVEVNVLEPVNAKAFLIYEDTETETLGLSEVELVSNTIGANLFETEEESVFSAECYDGVIYAYTDAGTFYAIDAATYDVISTSSVGSFASDMAFDYTTNTMYAVAANAANGEISDVVEVDLETGEMTVVSTLNFYALTFASHEGRFYAVSFGDGAFYEIDIETGEAEVLFNTGVEPAYIQTMAFNHNDGELYWLAVTGNGESFSAVIDVEEKNMTVLNNHEVINEYSGLYFDYEDDTPKVPVTGVTLDKTEVEINWGETAELIATVAPEDATNKRVIWESSDETVATVSKGVVTAVNGGEATITVTTVDGEFTATCKVTVKGTVTTLIYEDFEDALEGWTVLDKDGDGYSWDMEFPVEAGFEAYAGTGLISSASYINGGGALTPDNWLISPSFKADANTFATWYAVGQDADFCAENYSVYVLPADYTDVSQAIEVYSGVSGAAWAQVMADLSSYAGQEIRLAFRHYDVTDMFWLNLDEVRVITVDYGTDVAVTGVTLDKTNAIVKNLDKLQLTATVAPEDATNKELVWTSSDESIATVDATGLVTTVAPGTVTITVKTVDGEFTATCEIKVVVPADLNGDGKVNTGDAVVILRYVAELVQLNDEQLAAGDINADGTINVGDAVLVLRHTVGLIEIPGIPVVDDGGDVGGSDVVDSGDVGGSDVTNP